MRHAINMWRTRQAPRFAATMHISDSSLASEATPKLGLNLKADLRNPLTDKKRKKPKPKPKPKQVFEDFIGGRDRI